MEAKSQKIIDLIGVKDDFFSIPTYQRKYTWKAKKEIATLLNDLEEYQRSEVKDYFLGSIIVKRTWSLNYSEYILVDGQQRITTILILLSAIMDSIEDKNQELWIIISNKLKSKENKFKLERIHDQEIIKLILTNKSEILSNEQKMSNYFEVYSFFKLYFKKFSYDEKVNFYESVITNIKLAIIDLEEKEDEHLVFESINSKGKNLSSSDLIKNSIVMSLMKNNDKKSIERFENVFLKGFGENDEDILQFYRQIFAIETGKLLSSSTKAIYYEFKNKLKNNNNFIDSSYVEYLIKNQKIWNYINKNEFSFWSRPLFKTNNLNFYSIIHLTIEKNSIIDENKVQITNQNNINFSLKFLSKLVVARTLVSFGRVEGNKTYAKISNELNDELKINDDFKRAFNKTVINKLENSNNNYKMPTIKEINDIDAKRDLYTSLKTNLKWIMIAMEIYISKNKREYFDNIDKISIEHIFPQKPEKEWDKIEEKEGIKIKFNDYSELRDWLNTLGNLSITEHNSTLSNKSLAEKQKILEEKSYLKINKEVYSYNSWGVEEIKDRAKKILNIMHEIWFN